MSLPLPALFSVLAFKRAAARLILLAERIGAAYWGATSWAAVFCGIWLLEVQGIFGRGVEIGLWIVFLIGFAVLLRRSAHAFSMPKLQDVDRRMERAGGLSHHPLEMIEDRLSNSGQSVTMALWTLARQRALSVTPRLRVPAPLPLLTRLDPMALRVAAVLVLVMGLFSAGGQAPARLVRGAFPFSFAALSPEARPETLTVWITPPLYTGFGQTVVRGSGALDKPLKIPTGSTVRIRAKSWLLTPYVVLKGATLTLSQLEDRSYGLETTLTGGDSLSLREGFWTRATIPFELIPDQPPKVRLSSDDKKPVTLPDGSLRLPLMVQDDYGIRDLILSMRLDPLVEDAPMGKPFDESRTVLIPGGTEERPISPTLDLTSHSWAGLPALLSITVRDHAGQEASLPPLSITLPERPFRHPVAQRLIALRKKLAWGPRTAAQAVSSELLELASQPDRYQEDGLVFLGMETAAARLAYSDPEASADAVMTLLWKLALRIEDGGDLNLASHDLMEAQKRLAEALENPKSTPDELAQRMADLRSAMARYMKELHRALQKQQSTADAMPLLPPDALIKAIKPEALLRALEEMESRIAGGDRQAAEQMLSELQSMMQSLSPSLASPMPPDMQMMQKGINELQQLIERQQELMEQTRRQAGSQLEDLPGLGMPAAPGGSAGGGGDDGMPPQPSPAQPNPGGGIDAMGRKAEQESLRLILGQLMREAGAALPDLPPNLGAAEQAMRQSSKALGRGDLPGSLPHQKTALDELRKGQQGLGQQMGQRMQQMLGFGMGQQPLDPLGRPMGNREGPQIGGDVKIPDQAERKRVQDILKQLRDRSGELSRPPEELDYYRRLLQKF